MYVYVYGNGYMYIHEYEFGNINTWYGYVCMSAYVLKDIHTSADISQSRLSNAHNINSKFINTCTYTYVCSSVQLRTYVYVHRYVYVLCTFICLQTFNLIHAGTH